MSKTIKTHSSEPQDWHRQDVLAAVRKKGSNLAELGRQHGYTNSKTVYNVFNVNYPKMQKIIADYLGLAPEEIWPSRYPARIAA
ncbi:transcriptional regulator, Nlp family [Oceanospirillum multiglobuliferum]|uniref:Ner winged helix-turn-helix DNA-binding domain-containing protein n=1 Tax=Oceanospirillum multiglobuliferum TaxID=64969 RepID=A0A1T4QZ67_9GAMM|nr:helix-turn-helix domain-containing protein [Oceanospirillum multiglobuliferum]OPX57038.1 hypothetical protein BTE48_01000 [Oceanospirillum multiglobuliferum]SKA09069.1 transcriptional regulator, Nlp family [Oceanospirillum multiglobuliferum]